MLSAFSTSPGPALSPPTFRCHGDDVKLHHRSCPVNSLRGGASNPEKSTEEAIIFRLQQTDNGPTLEYISVLSCPKCAKLCIYRPVSVETRSEPRYVFDYSASSCYFVLFAFLRRVSNLDDAARSRLKSPESAKHSVTHLSDDDRRDHENECIKK